MSCIPLTNGNAGGGLGGAVSAQILGFRIPFLSSTYEHCQKDAVYVWQTSRGVCLGGVMSAQALGLCNAILSVTSKRWHVSVFLFQESVCVCAFPGGTVVLSAQIYTYWFSEGINQP